MQKRPIATKELEKVINTGFPAIETEIEFILNTVQRHYKYCLMPQHISETPVPDISTLDKDLGQATIFDAVFAGSDL